MTKCTVCHQGINSTYIRVDEKSLLNKVGFYCRSCDIYYDLNRKPYTKNDKELESAQKDQKKIGKAESNPETSGPAENVREEAAEMTDESQDSKEPA